MNRTDTATRRATTAIVAAVALFAAGHSFTHIYDLARHHGGVLCRLPCCPWPATG